MPLKKRGQEPSEDEEYQECQDVEVQISFRDLEKSMNVFTGDDTYPVTEFIEEFEDVADLMKWTNVEKLLYAKRLLEGTAKLFLRSIGRVKDYTNLKRALREEFAPKLNSATIHKRLVERKMKSDETYQQYFLTMKEIALHGKVEDAALMEYVIDGINDVETNKVILYGAADIKEFRKKLEIYSEFMKKLAKPTPTTSNYQGSDGNRRSGNDDNPKRRCYNCGAFDHQSSACEKGVKCFRCNYFGHKSDDCPNNNEQKKTVNILKVRNDDVPLEKIKIEGVDKDDQVVEYDIDDSRHTTEIKTMLDDCKPTEGIKKSNDSQIEHQPASRMKHDDVLSCLVLTETTALLKKAQDEDEYIQMLKEPYQNNILQNDMLPKGRDEDELLFVVLEKMHDEIIRENHKGGKEGLFNRINKRDDDLITMIDEENVERMNEIRRELREKAREFVETIQDGSVRVYNKKRNKARTYEKGDLRIGNTEGPDVMKSWIATEDEGISSGTDE